MSGIIKTLEQTLVDLAYVNENTLTVTRDSIIEFLQDTGEKMYRYVKNKKSLVEPDLDSILQESYAEDGDDIFFTMFEVEELCQKYQCLEEFTLIFNTRLKNLLKSKLIRSMATGAFNATTGKVVLENLYGFSEKKQTMGVLMTTDGSSANGAQQTEKVVQMLGGNATPLPKLENNNSKMLRDMKEGNAKYAIIEGVEDND